MDQYTLKTLVPIVHHVQWRHIQLSTKNERMKCMDSYSSPMQTCIQILSYSKSFLVLFFQILTYLCNFIMMMGLLESKFNFPVVNFLSVSYPNWHRKKIKNVKQNVWMHVLSRVIKIERGWQELPHSQQVNTGQDLEPLHKLIRSLLSCECQLGQKTI